MPPLDQKDRAEALVNAAREAARGMGRIAADKPDDALLKTNAHTLRSVAGILTGLATEMGRIAPPAEKMARALDRIASLQVRGAAELLEHSDWKKIASELQAIAQDALSAKPPATPR